MEMQGYAVPKPRTPRMTLENYLDFFTQTDKQSDAFAPLFLRKVIAVHGFSSNKVPKNDLMDAVRSIELMDPVRSTLTNYDVSSCAFLTREEVIRDLCTLHWQECCITSIQTLNSVDYNPISSSKDDAVDASASASAASSVVDCGLGAAGLGGNKVRGKGRKRKRLNSLGM